MVATVVGRIGKMFGTITPGDDASIASALNTGE